MALAALWSLDGVEAVQFGRHSRAAISSREATMDWWVLHGTPLQVDQGQLDKNVFATKADAFEFAKQIVSKGRRAVEINGPTGETLKEVEIADVVRQPSNPGV